MERTKYPGIYRRGSKLVVVWWHRGKQHKQSFSTMAEARKAKGQRDAGDSKPPAREKFEDYAREWIETYRGRTKAGVTGTTRADYRYSLEHYVIPHFKGYKLGEIEPPDVKAFARSLEETGAPRSTTRKRLAPLGALLATAFEDGLIRSNPSLGIRLGPAADEPRERRQAMTRAELAKFLKASPPEWRLFFEFLAHSGLRISEVVGLTWQNIDFGKHVIRVRWQIYKGTGKRPKSDFGVRDIPLSAGMARRLWQARRDSTFRGDGDPVFPAVNGEPLRPPNVHYRVLKPTARKAGLPWVSAHVFRHTCASLLFEAGKNAKQVQEWLGHHDPGYTLKTYVHLLDDGLGDADFLDLAVAAGGNKLATDDPKTAANGDAAEVTELAV
jgi:integrase